MIAALTIAERQRAIAISAVLALCGFAMTIAGSDTLFAVHGAIVLLFSLGCIGLVMSQYFAPEPSD